MNQCTDKEALTDSRDLIRVAKQGAVRVHGAAIYREAPGIVCILIELRSKHANPPIIGDGDNEPPCLFLAAGKDTLHLDDAHPRDSMTVVDFPRHIGWKVFACDGPARYTLSVVLVAPDASA